MFICYTKPLGDIVKKYGLQYHLYADDTQLYLAFRPKDPDSTADVLDKVKQCTQEIKKWMATHFLKLNDDKTEVLVITKRTVSTNQQIPSVQIGDSVIETTQQVRNLGVIFDSLCGLEKHISLVCRNAYYQIRNIGTIRKYVDQKTTQTLVHAYVTSRLDYCNSLLYGLPKHLLERLQRVQNTAARMITKTRKYDHITPVLKELHWLPIEERIEYKIILITFKALNDLAPKYISELLVPYKPSRTLRSQDQCYLCPPSTKTTKLGDRSFQKAAPLLWNNLPVDLRKLTKLNTFKSQLKTFLFKQAF